MIFNSGLEIFKKEEGLTRKGWIKNREKVMTLKETMKFIFNQLLLVMADRRKKSKKKENKNVIISRMKRVF